VDDAVGRVLGTLAKAGVADNTLVVLTSDNGSYMCNVSDPCSYVKPGKDGLGHVAHPHLQGFAAKNHRANYIYKGTKTDAWDGGHRVPFVVRWPGKTPAGKTCSVPVCLADIMATSADLLGQKLPDNAGEDSYNILPYFRGEKLDEQIRPGTVNHSISGFFALRRGPWKLEMCKGSGGWSFPRPRVADTMDLPPLQLYNLDEDISETTNVWDQYPDLVEEMKVQLKQYILDGRSTPGTPQEQVVPEKWRGIWWKE